MFVNPQKIVENKILRGVLDPEGQVRQCGIDLSINKLYRIQGSAHIAHDKNYRRLPKKIEVLPHVNPTTNEETFEIKPGLFYLFDCRETVAMPEDMMMQIIGRSSLMRVGVMAGSVVYDPGYIGSVGGYIYTIANSFTIGRVVPVGQAVFTVGEAASAYDGKYQNQSSQAL